MTFEWEESSARHKHYESDEVPLSHVMYGLDCPECGATVYNDGFIADADDPVWHYSCNDCGTLISVRPTKVSAHAVSGDD